MSAAVAASAKDVQMRANFRHLYADIFWFGVLMGSSFLLAPGASRCCGWTC